MTAHIRIWLDDQCFDSDCINRKAPSGWEPCDTALKAIRLIQSGNVEEISFDHDLGENRYTGYTVARFIESRAFAGVLGPIKWSIHSANPVGSAKIKAANIAADKFWAHSLSVPRKFNSKYR